MNNWNLSVPVALIIFDRPDTTQSVFTEIARAKPSKLLIVADGPRPNRPGESERCAAARAILERIDWDCEVLTNYSEVNLGCKRRVSSGLDWVFDNVEEAIILEDDCVPHPSFFRYCEELLERYRDETHVMAVSGDNFQFGRRRTEYSYYFSRYAHVWGWATWRRAWRYYDVSMRLWPEIRDRGGLIDLLGSKRQAAYWEKVFEAVYGGEIDTWDYQWTLSCWLQNGLTALPNVNLISNIGFGRHGTHTRSEESTFSAMKVNSLEFPLSHPPHVTRNAIADQFTESKMFNEPYIREMVKRAYRFLWRGLERETN